MDHKEDLDSRDSFSDIRKAPRNRSHHQYSKEELLGIKELPHSRLRPSCLLDKYDSDGVWDPEKWHASLYPNSGRSSPVDVLRKESDTERTSLKRRIADPRERVKEDDLDVVLSPQRRSFGGGCHVTAAVGSRRAGSPLDNKENESLRLIGGRRIGSGRIIAARAFDRDMRGGEKDLREPREGREREKEYKEKRFRREYGDSKRVFGERRRNDSYTEEEPEWFSGGPTSQSETIELTGFDDKILEEDQKGRKRTRKRTSSVKEVIECNGLVPEEEAALPPEHTADQEVPREAVLPGPAPGEFDFNEFFNLDKSVPGLASRNLDAHLMSNSDVTGPSTLQRNILQELLGPPISDPSSNVLNNVMGTLDPTTSLLRQRTPSPQIPVVFPTRSSSADYLRTRIPSPLGFSSGPEHFRTAMPKADSPLMAQVSPLEMQQAVLEGLVPHDLAFPASSYYHPVYGKMQIDKGRDGFRNRQQQRMNKSPVGSLRGSSVSPGPGAPVTSMLSPSFTPTSVIRKMYESKEKSKDETSIGKSAYGKEEARRVQEDGVLSPIPDNTIQGTSPVLGARFPTSQRSGCTPPLPHQSRYTKDQDYRPKSTGRQTPTMVPPVSGAPFLRPLHQVPVVPVVRPSHQLHPGLVQKMLAQGVPPQHLSLLQAGLLPPGIDLPALHTISPSVLGQPFYPLAPTGHPLLNQRPTNSLQLAMMQRSGSSTQSFSGIQGLSSRPNLNMMDQRFQRSTSPVGLAKWFGSDVLQQPLPSMPAKVISVDELEYRQ
ncbi:eukaryotic translation initiation factor 4E transporter isoform X4 [Mixophyes fleayi]|uniref:eukaryotic translation initiation factor 4E transporter isoform X4 n=1 Tax=Mixophyes fleayi TaxID=3061075 RepID=UPI003F4DDC54